MMTANDIQRLIEQHLPGSNATVTGDDGRHFEATVVCAAFAGKSKVQQQQMVYAILNDYIRSGELHALSLKTYATEV